MTEIQGINIWREAHRLSGVDIEHEQTEVIAFLLASAAVGPSEEAIAEILELEREKVDRWADRARSQKIWKGDRVYGNWFEEDGAISLAADACVVLGFLDRSPG